MMIWDGDAVRLLRIWGWYDTVTMLGCWGFEDDMIRWWCWGFEDLRMKWYGDDVGVLMIWRWYDTVMMLACRGSEDDMIRWWYWGFENDMIRWWCWGDECLFGSRCYMWIRKRRRRRRNLAGGLSWKGNYSIWKPRQIPTCDLISGWWITDSLSFAMHRCCYGIEWNFHASSAVVAVEATSPLWETELRTADQKERTRNFRAIQLTRNSFNVSFDAFETCRLDPWNVVWPIVISCQ